MPRGRPKKSDSGLDMSAMPKMAIRKLGMLQKSVGEAIGLEAFQKWWKSQPAKAPAGDANAEKLIELLKKHPEIKLPRNGLIVRRGGPKIIVEPAPARAATKAKAKRKPAKAKAKGGGGVHTGGG